MTATYEHDLAYVEFLDAARYETSSELVERVCYEARQAARDYVAEFDAPLAAEAWTDWDYVRWTDVLARTLSLTPDQQQVLWPVFRDTLTRHSRSICGA